ncbi:unnamed protein product [Prorocentrum cordatum]|uniref:Uncharacterized protein n=1 Tax=Prorocentrum cordatum TaxID=2364126 RepID=A0ABN9VII2_9DINO|nr:unnamed protein product [Polarella glacialis]
MYSQRRPEDVCNAPPWAIRNFCSPQVRWDSDLVLCQSVSGWFCDDEASDDLGSERDLTQDFAHPARAGPWTGGRCRAASALAGAEAGRRQTAVSALPPQLPASARGDCARGSDAVLVCRRPSRGPRLAALAGARLYGGGVAGASAPASEPRSSLGAAAADEEPDQELVLADTRVLLVCGALACFVGSVTAVYVALTHDPNRKEDRPLWRRGEYLAGASVVGALAMAVIAQRGGPK